MGWLKKAWRKAHNPLSGSFTGGMGFAQFVFDPIGFTIGRASRDLQKGLESLIEYPEIPAALAAGGKASNVSLRQNQARLDDVKTVGYGLWRDWPSYCAQPYTEYVNHEEVLKAWMHVSVGKANVKRVRIGSTLLNAYAGTKLEVVPRGVAMTLVHPNVYTSPDVSDLDLRGGAFSEVAIARAFTFVAPNRIEITGSGDRALAGFAAGTVITVAGAPLNSGTYTVVAAGDGPRFGWLIRGSWLTVTEAIVDETAAATLTYSQLSSLADIRTVKVEDQAFTLAGGKITGPEDSLIDYQVNDVVGIYGSADNDGTDFTVIGTENGDTLMVAPEPGLEGVPSATLYLKRRRVGPHPACPPGTRITKLAVHVFNEAGLGVADGDKLAARTLIFEVRYRAINDADQPVGVWHASRFEVTDNDVNPRRWTHYVELDTAARVQVDLCRISTEINDDKYRDTAVWAGLQGYIEPRPGETPGVDAQCTTVAVVVRASGMLARQQQRSISVDSQRVLPVLADGVWLEQETRNPAWAIVEWLTQQSSGQFTLDDIDLPAITALAEHCDANGIEFNAAFDQSVGFWEGVQSIARVARAKVLRDLDTQLFTIYRDSAVPARHLFADGINAKLGADALDLVTADSVTGVAVKWMDPTLWLERSSPVVGSAVDPRESSLMGCTSWQQAWLEANYQYRDSRLRVHTVALEGEQEALRARLGERALLASAAKRWGHGGEVREVYGRHLTVWPAPVWTPGVQHYVYLATAAGEMGARITCTRGTTDAELLLDADADVTLDTSADILPVFAFGHDGDDAAGIPADAPRLAIVQDMQPNGLRNAQVEFVLEDLAVHADPGPPPPDPYALNTDIPDMTITSIHAQMVGFLGINANWTNVPAATLYELEEQWDDASWRPLYAGPSYSVYIQVKPYAGDPPYPTATIRVRARTDGVVGDWFVGVILPAP